MDKEEALIEAFLRIDARFWLSQSFQDIDDLDDTNKGLLNHALMLAAARIDTALVHFRTDLNAVRSRNQE